MGLFDNKNAIVTGGNRGIGRAIAETLASEGAFVQIWAQNETEGAKVVKAIEEAGGKAEFVKIDISNSADVSAEVKKSAKTYGTIDVLINNAGITRDNIIMRMTEEEWDSVISINLKGVFNCLKSVSRYMLKQRSGKIVNISSVVGMMGNSGQANYSAAKAGVIALTKTAARELASRGVNVNCVAPGFIKTAMTDVLGDDAMKEVASQIPLGKIGDGTDIANCVKFLASEEASFITGQTIRVDGGMLM